MRFYSAHPPVLRCNAHEGSVIEVYIETDDVFLAPVFTRKPVHIQCPTLYVLVAPDMRIVSPVREVHPLVAKGYFVHPLSGAAKYDVRHVRYFGSHNFAFGSVMPRSRRLSAIRPVIVLDLSTGWMIPLSQPRN